MDGEGSVGTGGFYLDALTDEFSELRHYLTCCLQGRNAKVEIWKIENINVANRYEKHHGHMMRQPCWINAIDLDENNSLQEICSRGFSFNGKMFVSGTFDEHILNSTPDDINTFIYSDIAIGRSFVTDWTELQKNSELPNGYDSFYVVPNPLDRNNDGEFSLSEYQAAANFDGRDSMYYRHQYFVTNETQVWPRYIIRFSLSESSQYVGSIDTSEKFTRKAVQPLDEITFFDPVLFRPMTLRDTLAPANSTRKFLTIDEAFEQALVDHTRADPVYVGKSDWLETQRDNVDDKFRAINLNYVDLKETIEKAADREKASLQQLTKVKLLHLQSLEIELHRQQEQFAWANAVLEKHMNNMLSSLAQTGIDPKAVLEGKLEYLRAWRCHTLLLNNLCREQPTEMQMLDAIHPDMALKENLSVYLATDEPKDVALSVVSAGQQGANVTVGDPSQDNRQVQSSLAAYLSEMAPLTNSVAVRPRDDLLPSMLQDIVNKQSDKIQAALSRLLAGTEQTEAGQACPLPSCLFSSAHVPPGAGDVYSIPLPVLLRSSGGSLSTLPRQNMKVDPRALFENKLSGVLNDGMDEQLCIKKQSLFASQPSGVDFHIEDDGALYLGPDRVPVTPPRTADRTGGASKQASTKPLESADKSSVTKSSNTQQTGSTVQAQRSAVGRPAAAVSVSVPVKRSLSTDSSHLQGQGRSVTMSLEQLQAIAAKYSQYGMNDAAMRKMKQFQSKVHDTNCILASACLAQGTILHPPEATTLFFNLPFFASPPVCRLVFSTRKHLRSLDEIYMKTMLTNGPCLVVLSANNYKLGAYLSHPLHLSGTWCGSPACFLFNSTLGVKLPYHARRPPESASAGASSAAFLADRDFLMFGNNDLRISGDLKSGSSTVEGCFGMGLPAGSVEASCVLAGAASFFIDQLEIWSLN